MKHLWKFALLFLACLFQVLAQDPPAKCHVRNWDHPLSSNVCDADYQTWLKDRYFPPVRKDKQFW